MQDNAGVGLAAAEALFFALDTPGYGTLSFPQIEMLNFALMIWHAQYAGQTIDDYDEFAENVRQRTFDMLRDMGGTVENVYSYIGIIGLDAFKHFLILRQVKIENIHATLAVIRSFSAIWGDIRTRHIKDRYRLHMRQVEAGTKNIPRPFEISVLHSSIAQVNLDSSNSDSTSRHLPGPSLDMYLLVDAAPVVWNTMVRTVAASRQQGIFNSSNGATSITREGWAKVAGDIWHEFTKLEGVDIPTSLESLLQDGRAHKILAVLSTYQNLQREIIGVFLQQYESGQYALSNNLGGSSFDLEARSNLGDEGNANSVMPLVFPIVNSRTNLQRNNVRNESEGRAMPVNSEEMYSSADVDKEMPIRNGGSGWKEVTYDTLFTDEYLNASGPMKSSDISSNSNRPSRNQRKIDLDDNSRLPVAAQGASVLNKISETKTTRKNISNVRSKAILTEEIRLYNETYDEQKLVVADLKDPNIGRSGNKEIQVESKEPRGASKDAKELQAGSSTFTVERKLRAPEVHKLSPVLVRDVENLLKESKSRGPTSTSHIVEENIIGSGANNKAPYAKSQS